MDQDWVFRDTHGKVRLIIEASGRITVTRRYSWNGCSPRMCVFDLSVGTPNGVVHARTGQPKTYYASMIHDALYQFLRVNLPLTRRQADACFLRLMAESDFRPRHIYWAIVRVVGRLVWLAKRASRTWRGSGVPVSALLTPAQSLRGTPGGGDTARA